MGFVIILSELICKQHLLYDTSRASEEKVGNARSNFSAIRGIPIMEFIFLLRTSVSIQSAKNTDPPFSSYIRQGFPKYKTARNHQWKQRLRWLNTNIIWPYVWRLYYLERVVRIGLRTGLWHFYIRDYLCKRC